MRNYILIISILTIIMVFIVIYLSDYIKGTYFADCREDFRDAISIISGAAANANAIAELSYARPSLSSAKPRPSYTSAKLR